MTLNSVKMNLKRLGLWECLLFYLSRAHTSLCLGIMRAYVAIRPKARQMIVLRSAVDCSDNALALFEYLMSEGYDQKYRIVWCVSDPKPFAGKYPPTVRFVTVQGKHGWTSFRAVYCCSVAKYVFYTHNTAGLHISRCPDQVLVNLWHGNGYKASDGGGRKDDLHVFDYALVSGSVFAQTKARFWNCAPDRLLEMGFPRYDWMLQGGEPEDVVHRVFGQTLGGRKLILWMPTFLRHSGADFAEGEIQTFCGFSGLRSREELLSLNAHCRENGVVCVIKRHPFQSVWMDSETLDSVWFLEDRQLRDGGVQLSTLMCVSDGMLTDYSSAAVDFLLMDRPIGFVLTDYEAYGKTRGFVFDDPLAYMPGEKIWTFRQLLEFVSHVALGQDDFEPERENMRAIMHTPTDCYCKRIVEFFHL